MLQHDFDLPAGRLTLTVEETERPLEELCGVAARRNRKRPFLFVSKVLGKHFPVRPAAMRAVHRSLANKIGPHLVEPVVVVGMAETATALGHGVHEALFREQGLARSLFIHTTRIRLPSDRILEFREPHSHAPFHWIFAPHDGNDAALFRSARTLVLVDDEVTTGASLLNLATEYFRRINPHLRHIVVATVTDWLGTDRRKDLSARMPAATTVVSLLQGRFSFEDRTDWRDGPESPAGDDYQKQQETEVPGNYGRLGLKQCPQLEQALQHAETVSKPGMRVLVLGTGEFMFAPFKIAEHLEKIGCDVRYQATTRSPIEVGHEIGSKMEFLDNYGEGIPNYVYNVDALKYDRIIVGYETPNLLSEHRLLDLLPGSVPLFFR